MATSYELKEARKIATKISNYIIKRIKDFAPVDTGNLKFNAIVKVKESNNKIVIYVDKKIAPYMPYTNEPWISDKWNGKKNPNEAWWNDAFDTIIKEVQEKFGIRS